MDLREKENTHHGNLERTVMTQHLIAIEETSSTPSEMNYLLPRQSLHPKTEEIWIYGVNTTRNIGTHYQIAAN